MKKIDYVILNFGAQIEYILLNINNNRICFIELQQPLVQPLVQQLLVQRPLVSTDQSKVHFCRMPTLLVTDGSLMLATDFGDQSHQYDNSATNKIVIT